MSIKRIAGNHQELLAHSYLYLAMKINGDSLLPQNKVNKNADICKYPFEMIWGMIFFLSLLT